MGRRRKGRSPSVHGVVLVDKPAGVTSHDVVDFVRWGLGSGRVGHCGTLDPAATGLLVVCVGPATRLCQHLSGVDKTYRARFVLGRSTDTADADGRVVEEAACTLEQGRAGAKILEGMLGRHLLPPPAYSAVRVEGRRAHALARAGEIDHQTLEARPMRVLSVDDVRVGEDAGVVSIEATLRVGKGTYVRSLAVELGRRLGVPAHLGALRRLESGTLSVTDPRMLGPFDVTVVSPEGSDAEDRKPRRRLRLAGIGPGRAEQEAALRAALVPVWEVLPFPLVQARVDPRGDAVLRSLAQGRAVPADDPGLVEPVKVRGRVGVARTDPKAPTLIVARVEDDETARIQPERVVLFPDAPASCA